MELILTSNGERINPHTGITGRCSDRLSEKGVLDSLRLANALKDEKIDFIFCSDIGFRRTTTDLIFSELKYKDLQIIVDPNFREKSAEICTDYIKGKLKTLDKDKDAEQEEIVSRLFIREDLKSSNGMTKEESDQDIYDRCKHILSDLSTNYPSDARVLIVGNLIFNKYLCAELNNKEGNHEDYFSYNCSLSYFSNRGGEWKMLSFDNTDHLFGH